MITYLEQAKACAYYVDGFGVGMENVSAGFFIDAEHRMWYFLLLAADAGEL